MKIRKAFPYLIVAAGGFLIAYVITFLFAFPSDVLPDEGILPIVIGLPYEDAARALEKSGFVALQGERRIHKTAPEGTVLEQDPPAESRQKRGVDVRLAVSAGPAPAGDNMPLPVDTVTNQGPVVPERPEGVMEPYIPPPAPPPGSFQIETTSTTPTTPTTPPNTPRWPSPPRPTPVPNVPPPAPAPPPPPPVAPLPPDSTRQ
jgi:hypothetical protein